MGYKDMDRKEKMQLVQVISGLLTLLFGSGIIILIVNSCKANVPPKISDYTEVHNPYSDVAEDSYYFEPALWAYYHDPQIIGPTGDGTLFSPHNNCTREQVLTFLWKANGAPKPKQSVNPFSDVKEGEYYYQAVLWALETGVVTDGSGGKLGVGELCSRSDALYFVWNAQGCPFPTSIVSSFPDVNQGDYYHQAVLWAVEKGYINGTSKSKNTFEPKRACERAMIASILYKIYEK